MKKTFKIGGIFLFLSILLLAGCGEIFEPPQRDFMEEQLVLSMGVGNLTINIGSSPFERTLLPGLPSPWDIYDSNYRIDYYPRSGQEEKTSDYISGNYFYWYDTTLQTGYWDITVTLFAEIFMEELNSSDIYQVATGSESVYINPGNNYADINIFMGTGDGGGIFDYSGISFPGDLTGATLTVKYFSSRENAASPINLLASNSGFMYLDSGYYILYLTLSRGEATLTKVEVIHIYPGLKTYAEGHDYTFTNNDFLQIIPMPGSPVISSLSVTATSITFSWGAVEYADSYDIQYREDGGGAFGYYAMEYTGTSVTISGLKSDTRYYVRVRARNMMGASSWSDLYSSYSIVTGVGSVTAPGQPAAVAGNAMITVSWESVTNAVSYQVQYRIVVVEDEEYGTPVDYLPGETITVTSINIIGLTNGTAYQVRVRAVNSAGTAGDYSTWSRSRTPDATILSAPASVYITDLTSTGFRVNWSSIGLAENYRVYISTTNSHNQVPPTGTWSTTYRDIITYRNLDDVDTPITPGTIYYVWVRSRDENGDLSGYTPSVKVTTPLPAPTIGGVTGGKESLNVYFGYYRSIYNDPNYNSSLPVLTKGSYYYGYYVPTSHQFYAYSGVSYAINLTDSDNGGSSYRDCRLTIYWADTPSTLIVNNQDINNYTLNAARSGIVIITVNPFSGTSGTGYYNLRYSVNSGTEPDYMPDYDVDAYDFYLSTSYWDSPYSNIPTATISGDVYPAVINELTPNTTYYVWARAKNDNNGEWVYSDWSSYASGRVLNNQARMENFYLYYNSSYNYGTVRGNTINFVIPNSVSLSSIMTYFALSAGAESDHVSDTSYNYTSSRNITVIAEDGETINTYTINITGINTPFNIQFRVPYDYGDDITVENAPSTISQSVGEILLEALYYYYEYRWIINNVNVGSGYQYTLNAADLPLGPNSITLVIDMWGDYYSKTIEFTVTP